MDNFEQRQLDVYSQFMEGRIKAFYREVYAFSLSMPNACSGGGFPIWRKTVCRMPCSRPMASAARCALPPT